MPQAKSRTAPAVHHERPAAGLDAACLNAVLAEPKKAVKWSRWIEKVGAFQNEIGEVQTADGKLLVAWWVRPDLPCLVLRFKWGYYPAEARYRLTGEGDKAKLEADFPLPPPGYPADSKAVETRLAAELEALEALVRKG